ncbi:hypothetical protein BDN71DRAFT_1445624 [Pleurotus eryngii]|uniref:DUF6534 domain-containing protein n=1 Tax=Pleurotus eryngii TaxID=5323 RepID=A0A9P6DA02_PLEER|nr:hypothetical protein BDN71DRAFT_1445624 [Pleurotus eryngii]
MTTADPSTVAAPLVLAYLINYLLYGVSVVQFLLYLIQYPRDRSSLKMLVWLIFLLETVTTAVVGFVGWATFGEGFGDIVSLNYLPSGWALFPFISGIITTIVQNFLSWRIYRLTNRIWLSGVIFVISVVGCAFSFFFGVRVIQLGLHYDSPQAAGKYLDVWISCAAVCDVLGTGAIVTILTKSYSKTLRGSTRTMVSNLLKFSVETGLVATIWAIIHVSLWATMPQTSFHYIFYFSLPRL